MYRRHHHSDVQLVDELRRGQLRPIQASVGRVARRVRAHAARRVDDELDVQRGGPAGWGSGVASAPGVVGTMAVAAAPAALGPANNRAIMLATPSHPARRNAVVRRRRGVVSIDLLSPIRAAEMPRMTPMRRGRLEMKGRAIGPARRRHRAGDPNKRPVLVGCLRGSGPHSTAHAGVITVQAGNKSVPEGHRTAVPGSRHSPGNSDHRVPGAWLDVDELPLVGRVRPSRSSR